MKELYILSNNFGFIPQNTSISWKTDSYLWMCELQKWLREEHRFHVEINDFSTSSLDTVYFITLRTPGSEYYHKDNIEFALYEDALKYGLTELVKLINK